MHLGHQRVASTHFIHMLKDPTRCKYLHYIQSMLGLQEHSQKTTQDIELHLVFSAIVCCFLTYYSCYLDSEKQSYEETCPCNKVEGAKIMRDFFCLLRCWTPCPCK